MSHRRKFSSGSLAGLFLLATSVNASAGLIITEAMSSSGTGGTNDWIELTNTGLLPENITGYKFDDGSNNIANAVPLLGITTIAPGESVVFLETAFPLVDLPGFRTFWSGSATGLPTLQVGSYTGSGLGLSSTGDGANVFDAGGTNISSVTFPAATTGVSFGYNPNTNAFGGLSVAGQFGAYVSNNALANVASPGVIPEPSVYLLGAVGLTAIALVSNRRRKTNPAS